MATRYWVGGTGTWDNTSTANWSATSGGASGASYPVAGDTAIFNSSSGGGTVTLGANVTCAILTMTGFTGTLAYGTNKISIVSIAAGTIFTGDTTYNVSGTPLIECTATGNHNCTVAAGATTESNSVSFTLHTVGANGFTISGNLKHLNLTGFAGLGNNGGAKTVYGDVTFGSGTSTSGIGSGNTIWTFAATSGTQTITSNGRAFDQAITIATGGATVILADALNTVARAFILTSGTFDANGYNITVGSFSSTGTSTREVHMRSGTWTTTLSVGWTVSGTGVTVNCHTSTIYLTAAATTTFAGGDYTYYNLVLGGLTVAMGSSTSMAFNDISNVVVPAYVQLTAGSTYTFTNFNLNGNSTDDVRLYSTSSTPAIISKSSGTVNCSYLWVANITATGSATWNATNSIQYPNVTGWNISDANALYWVGGSGTWDLSDTTNWASTAGGSGGAGCPTSATRVVFSTDSGSGTVTIGANVVCRLLHTTVANTFGQFAGTLAFGTNYIDIIGSSRDIFSQSNTLTITGTPLVRFTTNATTGTRTFLAGGSTEAGSISVQVTAGSDIISLPANVKSVDMTGFSGTFLCATRTVWGNFKASPTMTYSGSTGAMSLRSSSPATIDCAGVSINQPVTLNTTSTYTLVSDLLMVTSRRLTVSSGTFDADIYNVTCNDTSIAGAGVTIYMGSAHWTLSSQWNIAAGATLYCETSTINMANTTTTNFVGAGYTYYNLNGSGTGQINVLSGGTFNDITHTNPPGTFNITAGITLTVANFSLSGILNDLVTLQSATAGSPFTLSKTSGTVNATYLSIKDCTATGGATWNATYSISVSGNSGWNITNTATTYYWVGGSGTWDSSTTTNWSLTSGGSGGAGCPNLNDIVIINSSSGAGTITIDTGAVCRTLTLTGFTGTLAFGSNKISVGGAAATVYTGDTTYSVTGDAKIESVYPGRISGRTFSSSVSITEANSVSVYVIAGSDSVSFVGQHRWKTIDLTGFRGTVVNTNKYLYGSLILSPTLVSMGGNQGITLAGSGSHVIDCAGFTSLSRSLVINCTGTYTLQSNLTILTYGITHTAGTFNANGYNVTAALLSSNSGTARTLYMGSGLWTLTVNTGNILLISPVNLTLYKGTAEIALTGTTGTKTISLSGVNLYKLTTNTPGTTSYTTDAVFDYFECLYAPHTIQLTSGVTLTINNSVTLEGNSLNQSALRSATPGSHAHISAPSGVIVNPEYLTVTDVIALGGAKWDAYGNVGNINGGNSPGWIWDQLNVDPSAFTQFF